VLLSRGERVTHADVIGAGRHRSRERFDRHRSAE
jgi:hypothetical protein